MSKVPVNYDQLCGLADLARRVGTLDVFADVALQWAGQADKEIERLTAALKWEQSRAGRQCTHGDGCADWGPEHYECAIRERDELRRQLAEAGESIAAQARTIADLRGALIESREMIRVDRESLYETSVNPDGAIDCEDDRKALAEYDDHLDYIAQVLGECVPAAMDITRPAEE